MVVTVKLHFVVLVLLVHTTHVLCAQQYNGRGGVLQDSVSVEAADTFLLKVAALDLIVDGEIGLQKVCFSINHPRTSDLKVTLVNPLGEAIWLTNRNGGEKGRHFSGTCFTATGFHGYVHQGENPFAGEYLPDGRFEFLQAPAEDLTGDWKLIIQDLRAGARGYLGAWQLYFGELGRQEPYPCREDNPQGCLTQNGDDDGELLPDLVMLPSFTRDQFVEYGPEHTSYPRQIKFAATIANVGLGPMEIRGSNTWFCGEDEVESPSVWCPDGNRPRQPILQRIYHRIDDDLIVEERKAGTNYYDDKPGHGHYHVDDWVEYTLLKAAPDGTETIICEGTKVSYCLFDSGICLDSDSLCMIDGVNYGPDVLTNYGLGDFADCHSGYQGISVGGYDTYGSMYEGQYLTLPEGTPNGTYILQIHVDPLDLYTELNTTNNTLRIEVELNKQGVN